MSGGGWVAGAVACLCLALSPGSARALVHSGTGFFITPDGQILTSAHVVRDCQEIAVFSPLAGRVVATLRASSARLDIALLSVPNSPVRYPVPWGLQDPLVGAHIHALAYGVQRSNPEQAVPLTGTIANRDEQRPALFSIDALVDQGTSGAPVLDETNALVGVIIGRYTASPEKGVMVSSAAIRSFLAEHDVAPPAPPTHRSALIGPSVVLRTTAMLVQCIPRHPIAQPGRPEPR